MLTSLIELRGLGLDISLVVRVSERPAKAIGFSSTSIPAGSPRAPRPNSVTAGAGYGAIAMPCGSRCPDHWEVYKLLLIMYLDRLTAPLKELPRNVWSSPCPGE